jgi:hypothetical protein
MSDSRITNRAASGGGEDRFGIKAQVSADRIPTKLPQGVATRPKPQASPPPPAPTPGQ